MKKIVAVLMALSLMLVLLPAGLAAEDNGSEITAPDEGEYVCGMTTFKASTDARFDDVQWAVRQGTCERSEGTVFGNVDGYEDDYAWDGNNFSATADTSDWEPGRYCFVFNPGASDNPDLRQERWFWVVEYGVEWLPPISLEDWTLNDNATLPIKFQLQECDGTPVCDPDIDLTLTVNEEPQELRFDDEECHYIANFRPTESGVHTAVVLVDDIEVGSIEFDVVEPGQANGQGRGK